MKPARDVAVAVSGGVDSLYALAVLAERDEALVAVHGRFHDAGPKAEAETEAEIGALAAACARLGVPFELLDLRAEFERLVVAPFVAAWRRGETPNPCSLCNPAMKFGLLFDRAAALGAVRLATGHYARLEPDAEGLGRLRRGADPAKDQSYFLALVPVERLARAVFPLGERRKAEVPGLLAERGLAAPVRPESQEICFVPDADYQGFLEARGAVLPGPGAVVRADGRVVGEHQGLWRYTEGQRRGLGGGHMEPMYVLGKDLPGNRLVVGPRPELDVAGFPAGRLNALIPLRRWPGTVLVQTRYRQGPAPARVERRGGGLVVRFETPQERPAPGQAAVFYEPDGRVLGGALVEAGPVEAAETGAPEGPGEAVS
ncbi:MAG: tRNA 2-thiouridine(34) synthase MnmA [Desulfovibrionaceae bacterium]